MRFLKLLEIIALSLLVFICIISGDNSKNTSTSVSAVHSKLTVTLPPASNAADSFVRARNTYNSNL